jgi:KDO2-lipid IV(A) lauroyltransferase
MALDRSNASFLQKVSWRLEAIIWDGYTAFFRMFSIDRASDMGASILRTIGPLTPSHNIARINMQRCFPEAEAPELDRLLGQMWDEFGRLFGEMPHMEKFADPEFFAERVDFVGRERLVEAAAAQQSLVVLGLHKSNWEILGAAINQTGLNCQITYRQANNPYIDDRIQSTRAAYGIRLMAAKGGEGARQLIQAFKNGESIALMNDQKMNDGIEVPFFEHPAMTAPGPSRLALRHDAPLQPISIRRLDGVRFRVTAHEPITKSDKSDRAEAIHDTVVNINHWAEDTIRDAPAQWFWVHRRWAKSIYKKT